MLAVGALVAIPAFGATPKTGDWSGKAKTSNGEHNGDVQFSTIKHGRHVSEFVLQHFGFSCFDNAGNPAGGGGAQSSTTPVSQPKVKQGRFHFTEAITSGLTAEIVKARGRFTSKRRAEGTISWKLNDPSEDLICKTGKRHWKAKLSG